MVERSIFLTDGVIIAAPPELTSQISGSNRGKAPRFRQLRINTALQPGVQTGPGAKPFQRLGPPFAAPKKNVKISLDATVHICYIQS